MQAHSAAYLPLRIQLKVPKAAAAVAAEALFGNRGREEGALEDEEGSEAAAGAVPAWHGVEVVVVGEFEALLRARPDRCRLSQLGKHMPGMHKWRLFAREVVSELIMGLLSALSDLRVLDQQGLDVPQGFLSAVKCRVGLPRYRRKKAHALWTPL